MMLIESISLNNFRQYYNSQTIHFSKSSNRNITVIHGENGSGKTALLNAFSWCLYGIITLPNEKNIINEHAIATANIGDHVEGSVKLVFLDNGRKYTTTRKIKAIKEAVNKVTYLEPELIVEYKEENGLLKSVNNPTIELNRILPEDLRTYFFFDGERIDNLSKDSGTDDVKKAIKNIMGLEILERAINHTEKARIRFRGELKKYGDSQTVNLIEELDKLEQKKDELKNDEAHQKENLNATNKQISDVETRLKQIEGAKQLQDKRDAKTEELVSVQDKIKQTRKGLSDLLSKKGYLAFSYSAIQKADSIIKESNNNNSTVSVSQQLLDQLIERGKCICGEKLIAGSDHYQHIAQLKQLVKENQSEYKIIDFASRLTLVKERKANLINEMRQLKAIEIEEIQKEKKLTEEIDEISEKLSGKETEEIVKLEEKRKELVSTRSLIDRKIGAIQGELEKVKEEIKNKNKEAEKHQSVEKKGKLTQKRMDVCFKLEDTMQEILGIREKLVRQQLQDRITNVYTQFLRKGYQVRLAENYELNVINDNGNIVGMSQGERQITSLSFIGAIVDIAREQYKKENKADFDEGGIYPLVMDSPFGTLDSDHRERIAKGIHKLSEQIIVIVSTSQWKGEVEEQMSDFIGKEYRLLYNDPRQNKEKPYEFTEVEEVNK